jgi:DNA polymerase-1
MVAAWLVTGKNKGIGLKLLARHVLERESPEYDPTIGTRPAADCLEYACHDALNTLQLGQYYYKWGKLCLQESWFHQECDFAMLLAEVKLAGLTLDRDHLREVRKDADAEALQYLNDWKDLAPHIFDKDEWGDDVDSHQIKIGSTKDLQELFRLGHWKEHGKTKTGFSTGKEAVVYNVTHGSELGKQLAVIRLGYQEVSKIVTTYTDGLIEESLQWADKKLHPDLHQFGTVTGRLASANPNIQNQPAHGNWADAIRKAFVPEEDMLFTAADYSQVELRYFADYCGGNLRKAFIAGADLHEATAKALGIDRKKGKAVNFGFLLYGGGPRKLAGLLECTEEEAKGHIKKLHEAYPEVEAWRQRVIEDVRYREPTPWCKTRVGRIRYFPELNPMQWMRTDPEAYEAAAKAIAAKYNFPINATNYKGDLRVNSALYSKGTRLVVNYLVQGGSRDLLVIGMNNFREQTRDLTDVSIVTTVHDEVLIQHRSDDKVAPTLLRDCLEAAGEELGMKVPLVANPKTGANWSEVK